MGFYSTSKVWKKDETAALIALFETERCLYDSSDRDFHDPDKNDEAFERICKIMLRIRPDVSIDEIKYKIKVLRKQYEGELLHRNISIETGLCTKGSYKPGMWCFGLLQFLDDYLDVKCVDEINKAEEDCDEENYHTTERDQKDIEESSDNVYESDDHEDTDEKVVSCKKRKVENSSSSSSSSSPSSSSSSERESLNSSIRKFVSSSSEKKHQKNSFSFKKFQSSSSIEKKQQNSSFSARKFHGNSSSEKKIQEPPLTKKSQNISSSFRKSQNTLPSQKKIVNPSPSSSKLQNASSFVQKMPSSSKFERDRKCSSSSERELKNPSLTKESKNFSLEKNLHKSPPEIKIKSSPSDVKETKPTLLDMELLCNPFSGNEFDITERFSRRNNSIDREDIFGTYVASELKALKGNTLLYLQTKQAILENLTSASFELIHPE